MSSFIKQFIQNYCKYHNLDYKQIINEINSETTKYSNINITIEPYTQKSFKMLGDTTLIEKQLTQINNCSYNATHKCWFVSNTSLQKVKQLLTQLKIPYEQTTETTSSPIPKATIDKTLEIKKKITEELEKEDIKEVVEDKKEKSKKEDKKEKSKKNKEESPKTKSKKDQTYFIICFDKIAISVMNAFLKKFNEIKKNYNGYIISEKYLNGIIKNMNTKNGKYVVSKSYQDNKYKEDENGYIFELINDEYIVSGIFEENEMLSLVDDDITFCMDKGWKYDKNSIQDDEE